MENVLLLGGGGQKFVFLLTWHIVSINTICCCASRDKNW